MKPLRPLFVGGLCATVAGCMFFRSVDDLSRETASDAASDGPSSVGDGPVASDASFDGDGPIASPCLGGSHTLCVDFDHGTVNDGWSSLDVTPGSQLTLDRSRSVSAPSSLLALLPRRSKSRVNAAVVAQRAGSRQRARVELDAYLEAPQWQAGDVGTGLLVLRFTSTTSITGTVLFMSNAGALVLSIEDRTTPSYFGGPAIPFGRWFHISLDFRVSGSLAYAIDGVSDTRTFSPVTLGNSPEVSLQIGLFGFDPPSPDTRAQYDDVVLDLE